MMTGARRALVRWRDRRRPCGIGLRHRSGATPARRSLVFYILPVQAPVLTATLAKALSTVLPDVDVQFVDRERGASS